jgi:hypothetical protein
MSRARVRLIRPTVACLFLSLLVLPMNKAEATALYSFSSIRFTPCGATGQSGPTLTQCATNTYSSQSWTSNTSFFNVISGIQYWTVPESGSYVITAAGAQGGANGGLGAVETATFSLTQGSVIRILVGQRGAGTFTGSGGGGSFVVATPYNTNASILVIAGGGGGYYAGACAVSAGGQTANSPTGGTATAATGGGGGGSTTVGGGAGFTNGQAVGASTYGGGGAGFGGNGGRYSNNTIASGLSFINGGTGGAGSGSFVGGFGGGGGIGDRGGGGGGYSGGNSENVKCAIGGGSYVSGTNVSAVGNANAGDGYVSISFTAPIATTTGLRFTNGGNSALYRTQIQLRADVSVDGRVTFLQNGKRIAACIKVQSVSLVAYCNWRASTRGSVALIASLTPGSGYLPSTSSSFNVLVSQRSLSR